MLKELQKRFAVRNQETEEREALMESMRSTRSALCRAYDGFNRASDRDLVDSYIYEINALQRRYAYLLRQARQLPDIAQ